MKKIIPFLVVCCLLFSCVAKKAVVTYKRDSPSTKHAVSGILGGLLTAGGIAADIITFNPTGLAHSLVVTVPMVKNDFEQINNEKKIVDLPEDKSVGVILQK